jgi:transcriptional regulator with XRE-family HTH domain
MIHLMPPRSHTLADAARLAGWIRDQIGREIRLARRNAGLRQQDVASRLGWSKSKVSRIERGMSRFVPVDALTLLGAVVGLRPSIRLYPVARPIRDAGQLELLAALNRRLSPSWQSQVEVPMPLEGDLRAADQLSAIPGCRVMIEAYTRLTDSQAQVRAARLKQRDLGAERLLIVVADTRSNREALRAAGMEALRSFAVSPRAMLAALEFGRDPGGDGIVLLRRAPTEPPETRPAALATTSHSAVRSVAPDATKGEGRAAHSSVVAADATSDV